MQSGPSRSTGSSPRGRRGRPASAARTAELHAPDPNSTEFAAFTSTPVIDLMPEQRNLDQMGGSMRLGLYPCKLLPGSHAHRAYGEEVVYERHRHRFEFNNEYREVMNEG